MAIEDVHRISDQLDSDTTQRLIDRLESRAKDTVFNRLLDQYAQELQFSDTTLTLELGCGTGAVARSLVGKPHFAGSMTGSDQSAAFIEAARTFAAQEGVGERVCFEQCDAHTPHFEDASFDIVIAHTLISHVTDPQKVVQEMARVLRQGGQLVIFDGDYASLTFACNDRELGHKMDNALAMTTFHNPLIMRDLVSLLPQAGFKITKTFSDVVSEIGHASYFKTFAETYVPMVVNAELVTQAEADAWFTLQKAAMEDGSFFASCNYYTYISEKTG